ncbi:MAG: GAF domain-containing protein, partial [Candidatus Electrothrix sp. AUS1_2]|nr:GAF domain-containing protein [Candidatus Electrothrix sp. AUS1_2]
MKTSPISDEKQQDIFELEQLADNELESFSKLMMFDTASIQILRDKQRYLIGAWGFPKDNNPRLLRGIDHDNLIKPIVERKKITILSNIAGEDDWSTEVTPEVHSWICAPLVVDNEVIGLLTIDSHNHANSYSYEKHEKQVEDFARNVAGRIKQWLSLHESKRRAEQLESLIAIGNELTSKIELNEDELFSLVERYAREALNIQNVTIWIVNDAKKVCPVKASRDGKIITLYTVQEKNTKIYAKGWEPRSTNEGRGKVKDVIDNNKSLVLYAQYIFDKKEYVL